VIQEADGTLSVRVPESIDRAFPQEIPSQFQPGLGACRISPDRVQIEAPASFACASAGPMPDRCKIEVTIDFDKSTRGCGVMLRISDDFETGYYIRLEPGRDRLVFDSWPRAGGTPFMVELERPLKLTPGAPVTLQLFVDGTICEVYAGGKIAMSARLYNHRAGNWGVFVNEGSARFSAVRLTTP
jgi:beta-fructofuranosidase